MRAYFIRKPESLQEIKSAAEWAKAQHKIPVELNVVGTVRLTKTQFTNFWKRPLLDRDYFVPFMEQSHWTKEGANCVMLECPGQPRIPVVLEGYQYARYMGWLEDLIPTPTRK